MTPCHPEPLRLLRPTGFVRIGRLFLALALTTMLPGEPAFADAYDCDPFC